MDEDTELLRRYAEEGSQDAFRDLVRRRMGLVYSSALRQLGDPQSAQEVAQAVFTDLARKAHALKKREILASWLYTSTHYAVANLARRERRRAARELEAYHMLETNAELSGDAAWVRLRPVIDEALNRLDARDRDAVILRFFEGRSYGEVGKSLGMSEEAARKRVERALERLRERLSARGVASSAAALSGLLAVKMTEAAPAGFADLVSKTAIVQAAGAGVSAGVLAYLAAGKTGLAAAAMAALVSVGGALYEVSRESAASDELARAQSRHAAVVSDLKSLENRVRDAEAALAEERKRLAVGAAGGSRPTGGSPAQDPKARGDQFLERHPEARSALIAYVDALNKTRFGPLYASLNLPPEKLAQLQELQRAGFSFGRPIQSGLVTLEAADSSVPYSEVSAQIKALLGDEGYRQYNAYTMNVTANDETASLAGLLAATDSPLTADQVRQVAAIFAGANVSHPPYGFDWAAAYAKAEAILSPSQLDMLHALGTEAIGYQQATGYGH